MLGEDLVDRIARERRQQQETEELQQRVALEQWAAVKENAGALWNALADRVRFLAEKYNQLLRDPFTFSLSDDGLTPHLEVRHEVFPVVVLSVVQESPHLMTFRIERTEASFAPTKGTHGRVQVTADTSRNLLMTVQSPNEERRLHRAEDLAEYLLEPVFRSTRI